MNISFPLAFILFAAGLGLTICGFWLLDHWHKGWAWRSADAEERRERRGVVIEGSSGTPLAETDAGKLGATIQKNTCPDCGSKQGFYEGPSGGMSTNIFCQKCGQGYNLTNMFGTGHAERIYRRCYHGFDKPDLCPTCRHFATVRNAP